MNPVLALILLLLPLSTGSLLARWLCRKAPLPLPLTLALGFGAGTGILTNLFVILNFVDLPHRFAWVTGGLVLMTALLLWVNLKTPVNTAMRVPFAPRPRPDGVNILLGLFSVYVMSYIVWSGFNVPIHSWDTFSTMGFKSKIILYSQSLEYIPHFAKFDYPLHLPTLIAWLAFGSGGWDDTLVKMIFPLYSLALTVVLFYALRLLTNGRWALVGVALLCSSNFFIYHSTIAYRDITMMFFNCSTVLLILMWQKTEFRSSLMLAALLSGLTSFIKLEGFGYLGMHNLLVLAILFFDKKVSWKDKFLRQAAFSALSIGIYAIFTVYKKTAILPFVPEWRVNPTHFDLNRLNLVMGMESLSRMGVVLQRYLENMFLSGNWNLVWVLFAASCLRLEAWARSATLRYLILFLGIYFAIYFASYSLTQHYFWVADKYDVMSRSMLHVFPLIPLAICLLNYNPDKD